MMAALQQLLALPASYRAYLILTALILLCAVIPQHWQQLLQYQRSGLEHDQYWRLLSGHLLHSNSWHLLMNLGGLLLAMLLHGQYFSARSFGLYVTGSMLLLSLALYCFSPDISIYVGLSGILHTLLTLGAVRDIQQKLTTGWLLLAGIIGKVSYEQWQGPDAELAELINASVAIDAHLYGAIIGLLCAGTVFVIARCSGKH
jgi:rhomboid family GlyGly-CTERM serine protease